MVNDIKVKLADELTKSIDSEAQVVYILSRVRKILESDNNKAHKALVFYCNWALHSKIDDISAVKDLVSGVLSKDSKALGEFTTFSIFHTDLQKFLVAYHIPVDLISTPEWQHNFNIYLSNIYTDTPMVIKQTTRKKITWSGSSGEKNYEGSFTVSEETE
jgi:hypothetical protein